MASLTLSITSETKRGELYRPPATIAAASSPAKGARERAVNYSNRAADGEHPLERSAREHLKRSLERSLMESDAPLDELLRSAERRASDKTESSTIPKVRLYDGFLLFQLHSWAKQIQYCSMVWMFTRKALISFQIRIYNKISNKIYIYVL